MDRQRRHHGYTTGHHLGLCLALALGLVLGTQMATAKECQRETPLPADVRLVAPGPHVPEAIAGFAGVWSTVWDNTDGLCHTLVVEEVFTNGLARVIYSHGTSVALNIPLPGFLHATGRIVDGMLRFRLPVRTALSWCIGLPTGRYSAPTRAHAAAV